MSLNVSDLFDHHHHHCDDDDDDQIDRKQQDS